MQNIIPLIPHQRIESAICQLSKWKKTSPVQQSQNNTKTCSMFGRDFVLGLWGRFGGWPAEVRDECGVVNPASQASLHDASTFQTQTTDAKKKFVLLYLTSRCLV